MFPLQDFFFRPVISVCFSMASVSCLEWEDVQISMNGLSYKLTQQHVMRQNIAD